MSDIRDEDFQDEFLEKMEDIISTIKYHIPVLYTVASHDPESLGKDGEVPVRSEKLYASHKSKEEISRCIQSLQELLDEAKPIKRFCVYGTATVTHSWSATVEAKDEEEAEDLFVDLSDGESIANGECHIETLEDFHVEVDNSDVAVSNVEEE
tara:strand:- start:104 stop:562 length:459 start_codon:yes stop_codon:yes gene_type:complete